MQAYLIFTEISLAGAGQQPPAALGRSGITHRTHHYK